MNFDRLLLLVAFALCFVTSGFAQRPSYQIRSSLGITGGITSFDINTGNFETTANTGIMGGLMVKGNLPHKWYDVSGGIQFAQGKMGMEGRSAQDATDIQEIEYNLLMVQLYMLMHWKLVPNHLEVDFGPMIQFSDKLKFEDNGQEAFYINGYDNIQASEIVELSQFNVNLAVGLTTGFKPFRLRFQYQYGVTNILGKLDDANLDTTGGDDDFKGHQGMITGTAIFFF